MLEFMISLKWPLVTLQIIIAPILIILILLQSGKGDDLGSALGGGGGGSTVLGTGGASKVLVKGTAIFAVLFMINSIALAKIFKELSSASYGTSVSEPLVPADSTTTPDLAPAKPKASEKTQPQSP